MLERDVIEQIYRRNFNRLLRTAAEIVGEDAARDVVHDVFFKFCNSDTLPASPDTYLCLAVRNRAISVLRHQSAHERFVAQNHQNAEFDESSYSLADELTGLVDNELSPRLRETIHHIYFRGESYKQAAASLNVSISTINKHIVTALRQLRTLLKRNQND